MEKQSRNLYESPSVDIVEIEVEKGFATSGTGTGEDGLPITPSNWNPFNFNQNQW